MVKKALQDTGFIPNATSLDITLSNAPPAVVYHIMSNLAVLSNPEISSIFYSNPPTEPFLQWPMDPPPAGLFALITSQEARVRTWAQKQSLKCSIIPIPFASFSESCREALHHAVSGLDSSFTEQGAQNRLSLALPLVDAPVDLWKAMCRLVRIIPVEMMSSNTQNNLDVRRGILGHLPDTGPRQSLSLYVVVNQLTSFFVFVLLCPEFESILDCFVVLLKRLGSKIWIGEAPDYPQVILDSIKDNPSFSDLVLSNPTGDRIKPLTWFSEYLRSVGDALIYDDILKKMTDFITGDLQHERFRDTRSSSMASGARVRHNLSLYINFLNYS
jgi:senataxin